MRSLIRLSAEDLQTLQTPIARAGPEESAPSYLAVASPVVLEASPSSNVEETTDDVATAAEAAEPVASGAQSDLCNDGNETLP